MGPALPVTSSHPINQAGKAANPSIKEFQLAESWKRTFTVAAPTLWNILPSEVRRPPTFLACRIGVKTWLCDLARVGTEDYARVGLSVSMRAPPPRVLTNVKWPSWNFLSF